MKRKYMISIVYLVTIILLLLSNRFRWDIDHKTILIL
jgi:hypothetical protein